MFVSDVLMVIFGILYRSSYRAYLSNLDQADLLNSDKWQIIGISISTE